MARERQHRTSRRAARPRARPSPGAARGAWGRRRGIATVVALVMMTVVMTLAVCFVGPLTTQVRQAENLTDIQAAQLQAESGLDFLVHQINNMSVPTGCQGSDLVAAVAATLASKLNGTANLRGAQVACNTGTIAVPTITTEAGKTFGAVLSLSQDSNTTIHMRVTGACGQVQRAVGVDLAVSGSDGFFGQYGVASKGRFVMTGNARVRGANNPAEANVLAGTYSFDEAANLTGNVTIQGELSLSNPASHATLVGNVSIGGESGEGAQDHVHVGVGPVEFPEVDPTVFEPYATNIVDAATSTSGNKTFENIRILANTNKNFSGNITLKGIIFIEKPNKITFTGNLTVIGIIVTQDAGENQYANNAIKFAGNTFVQGVENLPNQPQFAEIREMTGSFLLAPGFSVEFTGNFGTISGCMAADEFKWTGNAGGTIKGGIIHYGDNNFSMTGNTNLVFDRNGAPDRPVGFTMPSRLTIRPSTYVEY